jgi:hypothetical protein
LDCSVPGAWWPIALLNTLGKVLESIIGRWILSFSEECSLFPAQQMGSCPSRSIDTTNNFLV